MGDSNFIIEYLKQTYGDRLDARLTPSDLLALADFLSDKSFFLGNEPTALDAAAHGILANIWGAPFVSPVKERAHQLNNIVAYRDRMRDRYYPNTRN
jgi:glutathione S-transferase